MSIIVSEVYDALIDAGASEAKAKAAAAIPVVEHLATRGDVALVKGDLAQVKDDLAQVKDDLAQVKDDLAQVKGDLAQVKGDLAQVKAEVAGLKVAVFTFGPLILALLIRLVFFP